MALVRILGIDPGLRNTGWGMIATDGTRLSFLGCGTIHSDNKAALAERPASLVVKKRDRVRHQPALASRDQQAKRKSADQSGFGGRIIFAKKGRLIHRGLGRRKRERNGIIARSEQIR